MARVRVEKKRSRPRSSVVDATTATRMVGTAAMTANRPTICTCSREPARPRRRAWMTTQTSRPMMASSSSPVTALPSSSLTTTSWTGAIGVRPASTRKVAVADSSARPTAIAPISREATGIGVTAAGSSGGDLIDSRHCGFPDTSQGGLFRVNGQVRALPPVPE